MPTITFADPGSESTFDVSTLYANGAFTSGTGAISSATDQTDIGTHAIKSVAAALDDAANSSTADGPCADAGTRVSMRVRFSAWPTTNNSIFAVIWQTGFLNGTWVFGITPAGHLCVGSDGPGVLATGTATLTAATWLRLAFSYVITDGTHYTLKTYVNGVLDLTVTQANGTLTSIGSSVFTVGVVGIYGAAGFPHGDPMTVWFRDMVVDNGSDLADPATSPTDANALRLTAKRPIANGTTNGFTGTGTPSGTGTGNARYVNERAANQANFVSVVAVASAITEEYNIEGLSAGDVNLTGKTIRGVFGWVQTKALVSETGQIIVDGTATNIAITTTPTAFFKASATPTVYPAGTGADIGLITAATATTITLYEAGMIIVYDPAAGGAVVSSPALLSMGVQ